MFFSTSFTLVTGESSDPFNTVVIKRASIADAPFASAATAASVNEERCSAGCCAATKSGLAITMAKAISILTMNLLLLVFTLQIAGASELLRPRRSADKRKRDCDLLAWRRTALHPPYRPIESD